MIEVVDLGQLSPVIVYNEAMEIEFGPNGCEIAKAQGIIPDYRSHSIAVGDKLFSWCCNTHINLKEFRHEIQMIIGDVVVGYSHGDGYKYG